MDLLKNDFPQKQTMEQMSYPRAKFSRRIEANCQNRRADMTSNALTKRSLPFYLLTLGKTMDLWTERLSCMLFDIQPPTDEAKGGQKVPFDVSNARHSRLY